MIKIAVVLGFILVSFQLIAGSHRDSIDVLHYEICLDISNTSIHEIKGNTILEIRAFEPTAKIFLDLYKLTVDSILIENQLLSFSQNDTLLAIDYSIQSASESVFVNVYYHGIPQQDSEWGGFYFTNDYAYNMGVGMGDYPHGIGRYWYPCIDSFTDRATYDYKIKTSENNKAVCSGIFQNVTIDEQDSKPIYHWKLEQSIPTYLSSVAVGPYIEIYEVYNGINRDIPISIFVSQSDSSGATKTFSNLIASLQSFENRFGEYPWDRVGYVVVPFSGGAMEHAMNIAFPQYALTGSISNQNLAAHELAHSWFGNYVTCETSQEMWLNEGWASYAEAIFKQDVFTIEMAKSHIHSNHISVLKSAHLVDGGYYALNNIPHNITYGKTVYDKGADVVHSLRGYLGDSLFFKGVKKYLSNYAFSSVSSYDLMQSMSDETNVDLNSFFNNWVFQPGFPHYTIDNFTVEPLGDAYQASVSLSQKLKFRDVYGNKNKIPLTFMDNNWNTFDTVLEFDGQNESLVVELPFEATAVFTDLNQQVNDATNNDVQLITDLGYVQFNDCDFKLNTKQMQDSNFVNVIYNWVLPSPFKNQIDGVTISNYHYWKIEGLISDGFIADGKFSYAFSQNTNPDDNYDSGTSDTLVLLFRENPLFDWRVAMVGSSAQLSVGNIYYENLKFGEYAIGYWDGQTPLTSLKDENNTINYPIIYPNPMTNELNLEFEKSHKGNIYIYDINGKLQMKKKIHKAKYLLINTNSLVSGTYFMQIDGINSRRKIIKR
ncbi:MAG: T9SS type A sorting domain-containing protein [Salinivirgaceae bacterium]|nr:T9SS type A sorting domain-containing protein [Salinivirgaceae bacterium]